MSGGPGHRGPPLLAARATPSSSSASDSLHASNESSMDGLASATARDGASGTRSGNTVMAVREARSGTRPKRTLIESACAACRRRKSRCDGVRPACSRCQTLRTECAYEAEEGESRWSALRRRNQMLENERAESRELIAFLQTRPEAEAQEIFNRIRIGGYDDIFSLLRQVRDGELSTSVSRSSTPTRAGLNIPLAEQRLPSIRSIIEVPDHSHLPPAAPMGVATHQPPQRPPLLTPENSRGSTSSGASIEYPKSMPPL